jgi:hypothetical protein
MEQKNVSFGFGYLLTVDLALVGHSQQILNPVGTPHHKASGFIYSYNEKKCFALYYMNFCELAD